MKRSHSAAWRTRAAIIIVTLLACPAVAFAQKKEKLAKTYREWLEQDVVYIITKEERENFLKLSSDEARDKFIQRFWEIRNPTPGSPTNEYKEELYKRIAFANARFSVGSAEEGWRTDRGHAYILLGPPQQKQAHRNAANLYPLEIWFYSTGMAGLPNFFYLMFYDRDATGDYRFYSPYFDGPDKLVTGTEAINNATAGYAIVRNSVGPEVARISLSLLPGEPVDSSTGMRSMESDLLLSAIRGYANFPAYRNEIANRYKLREHVSTRMILSGRSLDILTFPVRDSRGQPRLDFALHLHNPNDMTLTKEKDDRYSYTIAVNVHVFGRDNKLLFSQEKTLSDTMSKQHMEEIQDKLFAYEGTLPLPTGKYRVVFEFVDWSRKASYEDEKEVVIPEPSDKSFLIPAILPFLSAEEIADPVLRDLTPFTMGGVHFKPFLSAAPTVNPEVPFQIAYQIWARARDPREMVGRKLSIEYGLGQPAIPGGNTSSRDELGMEQFDAYGSLVSGKKFDLSRYVSGNYVLTVTLAQPGTEERAYSTTHFKVVAEAESKDSWELDEPDILKDAQAGILDEERGLALLNQGQADEARRWLLRSLKLGRENDDARSALVEIYFNKKDYAAVSSLYADAGITPKTDTRTLIRIATSLAQSGQRTKGINLLQDSIAFRPEDGQLYLVLSDLYAQDGDTKRAAEMEKKGKVELGIN